MLKRGFDASGHITDDTYSTHFCRLRMRARLVEKENGIPKRWRFIGKLLAKHNISPTEATIPPKSAFSQ